MAGRAHPRSKPNARPATTFEDIMTKRLERLESAFESIGFKRPAHRKPPKNQNPYSQSVDEYDEHIEDELARLRRL